MDILLADNENFKFVTVIFAPYTGKQTYTYKTLLPLEVDDFVVVDTPSKGFQVVQVREVLTPFEVDLNVPFSYKWVVQKIDTAHYTEVRAMEKEVRVFVNKAKSKQAIEVAKALLVDSDVDTVTKLVRL